MRTRGMVGSHLTRRLMCALLYYEQLPNIGVCEYISTFFFSPAVNLDYADQKSTVGVS